MTTRLLSLILISSLFWFCSEPEETCCVLPNEPVAEPLTDADRVGLAWSDEFEGTGLDADYWTHDLGDGSNIGLPGWGNNEKQNYTNRPENLKIENGFLKIIARRENYENSEFTSARIKTQGKFSFTHGRMVVRARLPLGVGTWPAIWMLGNSVSSDGWPYCGEIDVVEQRGLDKNKLIGAVHWFDDASGNKADYQREYQSEGIGADFRKYTMEWTPDYIRMNVDGVRYFEIAVNGTMPFRDPFFILVNIAMGGTLGGNIGSSFSYDEMWIDYIRVYEN